MFKKLLIATLAVVVGVGLVSGTRLGSFLRMKLAKAQQAVVDHIPLESEIDRLKMEVADLSRDDERYYDQVARQTREVTRLRDKVTVSRATLARTEKFITSMRASLAQEGAFVVRDDTRWERSKAEAELRLTAMGFLADEKIVKADEENLNILEETLAANKAKLDGLVLRRKEMQSQVLVLESELAKQRLKDQSKMVVDDGRYGRVSKEIEEARERFDVLKTKAELRGESAKGSIRAQEERKAEGQKLDKAIEDRFGRVDTLKKVIED